MQISTENTPFIFFCKYDKKKKTFVLLPIRFRRQPKCFKIKTLLIIFFFR